MHPYQAHLPPLARQLRNNMTEAEKMLWQKLRRQQICGVHFYRQKPLANYIVDFYCAAAKLIVELDGGQHNEADAIAYDNERTDVLNALGLQVVRFDNRQVLCHLDEIIGVIYQIVKSKIESLPASL